MRILLLVALITQSLNVISQSHLIGVYGGLNFANAKGNDCQHQSGVFPGALFVDYQNSKNHYSPTIGITYDFVLKNKMVIATDLTYIQRKFTSETLYTDASGNPWNPSSVDFSFTHRSLSLPIKVGYTFGDRFYITPKGGFRLFYSLNVEDETGAAINSEQHEDFEYAIEGELEIGVPIMEHYILSSLLNFNKSLNSFQNPTTSNPKYRYIQFSVALKKKL